MKSPKRKRSILRPWLWPIRFLGKFSNPTIPISLRIINFIFQNLLDNNNDVPWMVHFTSKVSGDIKIGKNVKTHFAISGGCYFQGGNGIVIGDNTIFAPGVKVISANHNPDKYEVWIKNNPIVIGKRCWIGANATILPGVNLGDNVIVGAGAVVTKSFPSNSVLVGVPAVNKK